MEVSEITADQIPGTPSAAKAEALAQIADDGDWLDVGVRQKATRIKATGVWVPLHHLGGGLEIQLRTLASKKLKAKVDEWNKPLLAKIKDPVKRKKGELDGPLGEESNRGMLIHAIMAARGRIKNPDGSRRVFDGTEGAGEARHWVESAFLPPIDVDNIGESEDYDTGFLTELLSAFNAIEDISSADLARVGPTFLLTRRGPADYND